MQQTQTREREQELASQRRHQPRLLQSLHCRSSCWYVKLGSSSLSVDFTFQIFPMLFLIVRLSFKFSLLQNLDLDTTVCFAFDLGWNVPPSSFNGHLIR